MTDTTTQMNPDLQATVTGYFECWNAADETARRAAVERHWTSDATSTDPLASVAGHAAIAEMMASVQGSYPGHRFRQVGGLDTHHDVVRWGWEMVDADGQPVLDGIDVASVDDRGRITALAGFFGATLPDAAG